MTSRERVLTALDLGEPDHIPFCELGTSQKVVGELMGIDRLPTWHEIADFLNQDDVMCWDVGIPMYVKRRTSSDGVGFTVDGLIKTFDDLKMVQLPDPTTEEFMEPAYKFLDVKTDRARGIIINLGFDPAMQDMGMEHFFISLYENLDLVKALFEKITDWTAQYAGKLSQIGFDFIWAGDDLAYKTGPMFDPAIFHDVFMPGLKKVADNIALPWIFHSDGNIMPLVDDILSLGMNALHPFEADAMDIVEFKKDYGDRVCVVGNIMINTLSLGSPEQVDEEVKRKIKALGPGGGYMISTENSITDYCKGGNVLAMTQAIQKYGKYPINIV